MLDPYTMVDLIPALLLAAGWIVTNYLFRLNEMRRMRLERRHEMLLSIKPIWFAIQKGEADFTSPSFSEQFYEARGMFQLYGYDK